MTVNEALAIISQVAQQWQRIGWELTMAEELRT